MPDLEWIDSATAATRLRISGNTVRELTNEPGCPYVRIRSRLRFLWPALPIWLAERAKVARERANPRAVEVEAVSPSGSRSGADGGAVEVVADRPAEVPGGTCQSAANCIQEEEQEEESRA